MDNNDETMCHQRCKRYYNLHLMRFTGFGTGPIRVTIPVAFRALGLNYSCPQIRAKSTANPPLWDKAPSTKKLSQCVPNLTREWRRGNFSSAPRFIQSELYRDRLRKLASTFIGTLSANLYILRS